LFQEVIGMQVRRRWLLGCAGAAAALSSPWVRAAPAATLVLGQSVPLTGDASEIGLAYAGGAKLFVDSLNDRGEEGVRIELRQLDDGYSAERAAANATKLLDTGCEVLFGFAGTASTLAAAQVAQRRGAIFFAPYAGPDVLRGAAYPLVYLARPSMADEAFKMVQYCATIGLKRIAFVGDDDALGRAGLEAVNRAVAELKLPSLAATAVVPPNGTKVDAAVAAVKAVQPQAIIQAALFRSTAAFIQKMRGAGYAGAFLNFSTVGIDPLYFALDKQIAGVVVSQVVPSPRSKATPIVREYLTAIDATDQTPSYEGLEGFIAAKTLAEAVRRAGRGAGGGAALQRALAGMGHFDVGGFRVSLRSGVREAAAAVELVAISADGRLIR